MDRESKEPWLQNSAIELANEKIENYKKAQSRVSTKKSTKQSKLIGNQKNNFMIPSKIPVTQAK